MVKGNEIIESTKGTGPLRMVLRPFDSVWMGILWASILFVYCSIGSAVPAVRQHPALEMTEFEWFHWWPFNLLMVLICTTLVVVTVRRIPFRLVNLGVWSIHTGIIVLCIGSYYYFGTKIEGDTPIFRRRVRIEMPGLAKPVTLVALPGSQTSAMADGKRWRFVLQSTNSAWPILSDEHKGEVAYAVNVMVSPPRGDPFIRQLLAGYPQYTEDVIPGQGRAIKSLGRKLIEETLELTLEREPQEWFHVMDTAAVFVRRVGDIDWMERPIDGLPRYHEWIGSRDQVFMDSNAGIPLRSLDLAVSPSPKEHVGSPSMRVTGFLPYAQMRPQWREGGQRLNPMVRVSFYSDGARVRTHELLALDHRRSRSGDGMVELRWLDDGAKIADLPIDSRGGLHITVPQFDISIDVPITRQNVVGPDGDYTPLGASGFTYRIRNVQDNLVLPNNTGSISVAMVDVKTPDGEFTRMVADDASRTKDQRGTTADSNDAHGKFVKADERIGMTYRPESPPVLLAMYPRGLHLVVNDSSGRILGRDMEVGEMIEIVDGLSIRVDASWSTAVAEVKPYVVPRSARRRSAGSALAMIRLEVDTGRGIESRWLSFHQYALANEQYAYAGRLAYAPEHFRLADGSMIEVLFSRERRKLPHPIALEEFALDTHVGGYTGAALTIRNYVSHLSFNVDGSWTEATPIQVNAPTESGGYWFFQSTWDKPSNEDPTGGMNYTGLGVGNRNGVYIQLAGCCIAVGGMLFAFYVKPVLRRRRSQRSRAKAFGARDDPVEELAASISQAT